MTPSMMIRFVASEMKPVEVDGKTIHAVFRAAVSEGDIVRVKWISAASPRVQGIALRLRVPGVFGSKGYGGLLQIGKIAAPAHFLWMDSAPTVVEVECIELKKEAVLQISNRWRLPDGREDEWVNNYGMEIEQVSPKVVVLHCSDGYGDDLSLDDLVVQIAVDRKSPQC